MQSTVKQLKLFLFDMDGTLYLGDHLFPFTPALLQTIKRTGGRYMFMTNNSSKSVAASPDKPHFVMENAAEILDILKN